MRAKIKKRLRNKCQFIFCLTIFSLLLFSQGCVVAAERPYYPQEPPPRRPVELRGVEGSWAINVDNRWGKLEFHQRGNTLTGRVWFDSYQQWEELQDIHFDPRTGHLEFFRPNFNSLYSGTVSHQQIQGSFVYGGRTYSWEARRF